MVKHHILYEDTKLEVQEGEFLVGRSSKCNLVLDDASVSRVHAVIRNTKEKLTVMDKGSRNGIIVNGKLISGENELNDGDEIAIGHQKLRIATIDETKESDRTVGLRACEACGHWTNADQPFCSSCGKNIGRMPSGNPSAVAPGEELGKRPGKPKKDNLRESIIVEQQAITAMAGLALKILLMGKAQESERLITGAYKTALSRLGKNEELSDSDFVTLSKALLEYASATKSGKHISSVFKLNLDGQRLMSRELVEDLYEAVRKADYLACPDMTKYLSFLDTVKDNFNPGEHFVHRRLIGLVKICS